MMEYKIKALSIWELGKRANQEDAIYPALGEATEQDRLFILCDGMGGHEHGEVASNAVCQSMSQYVKANVSSNGTFTPDDFAHTLNAAYDALDEKDEEVERKMGTTLTFLKFYSDGVFAAHIGDSRIYQVRPAERRIVFQTRDHSLVNDLVSVGEITPEEAKHHPRKNVITRAMQPHQEKRSKADIKEITDIKAGDYFLMCSDGMLEQIEDENIVNILCMDKTDEEKVEILRGASEESRDNHSAHLIHVVEILTEENTKHVEPLQEKSEEKIQEETTQLPPVVKEQGMAEPIPERHYWREHYKAVALKWAVGILVVVIMILLAYIAYPRMKKALPKEGMKKDSVNIEHKVA